MFGFEYHANMINNMKGLGINLLANKYVFFLFSINLFRNKNWWNRLNGVYLVADSLIEPLQRVFLPLLLPHYLFCLHFRSHKGSQSEVNACLRQRERQREWKRKRQGGREREKKKKERIKEKQERERERE
jgi:hypothetical protein